jgi:hypothetical protein
MRIEHERPDDELDASRISEYLAVVHVITTITGGAPGSGVLLCPVCRTGELAYEITPTPHANRHKVHAVCSRSGCIRFTT